ncbi:hypothetical protein [Achromobacter sp. ESBL13]|uniref:hypothetical protein n=1 Tax=Achromobacter sp. ESBL13 TaxID=3077328 RepID=UPI002FC74649
MMGMIDLVKDPYERKARVMPGLLVVLPILVPLVSVYGPRHAILTAVLGVLGGCGAIYTLASVARMRGKDVEEKLVKRWGGLPTTISLRHRDTRYDSITKERYHRLAESKLGIPIPTAEEEAIEPAKADQMYAGVAVKVREDTRNDKALLLKENISYGFHRNCLGMRMPGVITSIAGIAYGLIAAGVLTVEPYAWHPARLADPGLPGGLTVAISAALLWAWLFHFNARAVRRAGDVYADRLFEAMSRLPTKRAKKAASNAA